MSLPHLDGIAALLLALPRQLSLLILLLLLLTPAPDFFGPPTQLVQPLLFFPAVPVQEAEVGSFDLKRGRQLKASLWLGWSSSRLCIQRSRVLIWVFFFFLLRNWCKKENLRSFAQLFFPDVRFGTRKVFSKETFDPSNAFSKKHYMILMVVTNHLLQTVITFQSYWKTLINEIIFHIFVIIFCHAWDLATEKIPR